MNDLALSRRRFLQGLAAASTLPLWIRMVDPVNAAVPAPNAHLLVVFLSGGNDALNTVVPLRDSRYSKMRPRTGLTSSEIINLGNGFGLNKALPGLHFRWKNSQLAVIQGVGTPQPDLSHFSATGAWDTASPDERFYTGWLGRYVDSTPERNIGAIRAAAIGDIMPLALAGEGEPAVTLRTMDSFDYVDHGMYDADARHEAFATFASDDGATGMQATVIAAHRRAISVLEPIRAVSAQNAEAGAAKTVAQLFAAGIGTEIGFITLEGFDTHSLQRGEHANRLSLLDQVVTNFFAEANRKGIASKSTVLVVSEFGRRGPENKSEGTDHGHGGVAFLIGPRVAGGMYGVEPDLGALVDGNATAPVDLRSLYASVLEQVLATDSETVLGARYPTLSLLK